VLFQCLKLQDLFLSVDLVRQRQRAVEVYLPEEVQGEGEVGSSVASTMDVQVLQMKMEEAFV